MVDAAHPPLDEQPDSLDSCIAFVVVEPGLGNIDLYPLLVRLGRNACPVVRTEIAFVFVVVADTVVAVAPVIVAFAVDVIEIAVAVVVEVVVDSVAVDVGTLDSPPAFV
jgi:hypothetical protein